MRFNYQYANILEHFQTLITVAGLLYLLCVRQYTRRKAQTLPNGRSPLRQRAHLSKPDLNTPTRCQQVQEWVCPKPLGLLKSSERPRWSLSENSAAPAAYLHMFLLNFLRVESVITITANHERTEFRTAAVTWRRWPASFADASDTMYKQQRKKVGSKLLCSKKTRG